jgi:VWFA-related protein
MGRRTLPLGVFVIAALAALGAHQGQSDAEKSLRITSPLGRTGLVTTVRIVAQVSLPTDVTLSEVEFFVDGAKIGTVVDGPPYALAWTDENPFERREIVVQAADSTGETLRDTVVLPAFEVEERTEVKAILLETGIYDVKTGRSISNVPEAAFSVLEDDVKQTIDLITRETVPTDVVLLVDNSNSMSARMDFVRRATEQLTAGLRERDRVIVAPFNAHVGAITGPTSDRRTISEAISAMRAGGGTAVLDSVLEGVRLLSNSEVRRVLVLITDGFDENSTATIADTLRAVEKSQATVYAVGIGGSAGIALRGADMLRQIAEISGGRAFFPPSLQDVVSVTKQVAEDTHSRFLVTYTPRNQKKDGRWRSIAVKVDGGYRVRTRAGYFAPAPPPIRQTFEFTVFDERRRYVGVTVDDLEVYENGVLQTVDTFQEAVDPVSIVLALDASGSMRKNAELVKSTAREFVLAVRPEDSLALIMFADAPKFAHALATNRQWSLDAIDKYVTLGGTALYDAIWNSLITLKGVKGRHAVVVFTDGKDENNPGTAPGSVHTLKDVLELSKEVGATIFGVGLGPGVDRPVLETLAEESGGQTYYADDASDLGRQFRRVVNDMRLRYTIGYTSTDSTHDGGWRTVEIRPKTPGRYTLSSGGYFAPDN